MSPLPFLRVRAWRCLSFSLLSISLIVTMCFSLTGVAQAQSTEIQWRHDWQQPLVSYLKSFKVEDVETQPVKVEASAFEGVTQPLERYRYLVGGYTPLLPFVQQLASFPAEDFTWKNLWRAELPLDQNFLTDTRLQLKQGQLWVPAHPSAACLYAWAYHEQAAWNPFAQSKPMANRAAVTAITALLGWTLGDDYSKDPESSYTGTRYGVHGGITGFTLTFQAYTLLRIKDTLPPAVAKAWGQGLAHMCQRIDSNAPTGPANMRLSVPVGMYYTWLATGDESIKQLYQKWIGQVLFSNLLSPAGHYNDGEGRGPDGSYNGIASHRISELYSITQDPEILKVLRQFYQLKAYQTLPEPDGSWLSPSHYNDRTQSSFANDQYGGRETQIATLIPEAALFLKRQRDGDRILTPAILASLGSRPSNRLPGAFEFNNGAGRGGRMHDWGNVLHLPDFEYHQDEKKIQEVLANSQTTLPVLASNHFTRNFNNEFFSVRRPGYYALFYTGAISTSDNGTTNYRNMLKSHGGLFNGFAGGGMSALWTPAGTFILGRLNAYENYEREAYKLPNAIYDIPGWQDWANNHLIGQTAEGKILGSARVSWPTSTLSEDNNHLTIASTFPKSSQRQAEITDADINYQRDYQFNDNAIHAKVTLTSNKNVTLKTFYEVIPVQITEDLKTVFLDAAGNELPEADVIANVKTIRLKRELGSLDIVLDQPRAISRVSVQVTSKQANKVDLRNLLITLPTSLVADKPVTLAYQLVPQVTSPDTTPAANTNAADQGWDHTDQNLKAVIEDKSFDLVAPFLLAHYTADSVEVSPDGKVIRWNDLSPNKLHLEPLDASTAPRLNASKTAVTFEPGQMLFRTLPDATSTDGLGATALIDTPANYRTTRPLGHARVISIATTQGADYTHGLSVNPYNPNAPTTGIYTLASSRRYKTTPDRPIHIALGGRLLSRDDKPVISGPLFKGDLYEFYVYNTFISPWQIGQLSDRMLRLQSKKSQPKSDQ